MTALADLPIDLTPVAVLDFETTGLRPGADRVVEVGVMRIDPGCEPQLVLDTLINPRRRMACTEIHGITDEDVADAPEFGEIAADLLAALGGCAVAAYNVYFDMRFLEYELDRAGFPRVPPHLCLMYLRPMLGLGGRCSLEDACREQGIANPKAHLAASDVFVEAMLYGLYKEIFRQRQYETFAELANLRRYKFCESFDLEPLPMMNGGNCRRLKPRRLETTPVTASAAGPQEGPVARRQLLREYWGALKIVLADLEVTDDEVAYMEKKKRELQLAPEEIRLQHARAFASVIAQFTEDQWLDDRECLKLNRLHRALARLGWAPGE